MHVTGAFEYPVEDVIILDTGVHLGAAPRVKIESMVWLVQEKLTLLLYWGMSDNSREFCLPMESRNFARFDNGLTPPKEWGGRLLIDVLNVQRDTMDLTTKHFLLILDLDKHG